MSNQTVCIVGASGGIGSETARLFLQNKGNDLILMDLASSEKSILSNELGLNIIEIDLKSSSSIKNAFVKGRSLFSKIDCLILVSGIVENKNLSSISTDLWDQIININLSGFFFCIKEAENWIADGGRVVTLGSMAGHQGSTITGPAYAASKAGIEGLTKHLALYFAERKITANCITPGPVKTKMLEAHDTKILSEAMKKIPLKRFASPKEIAGAILYLCSEEAAYITGSIFAINGGTRME